MGMIEKLRAKPEPYRRKVVLIITVSITLVIFIVWLTVTASKLTSPEGEKIVEIDEIDSPLVSFKDTFSGFFEDFKQGLKTFID